MMKEMNLNEMEMVNGAGAVSTAARKKLFKGIVDGICTVTGAVVNAVTTVKDYLDSLDPKKKTLEVICDNYDDIGITGGLGIADA